MIGIFSCCRRQHDHIVLVEYGVENELWQWHRKCLQTWSIQHVIKHHQNNFHLQMQCKFSVFVFNLPRTAVAATIQNQEVTFTYCKNNTRHCQFCFHRTESINESQNCTKPFCSSQYRECTVHFFYHHSPQNRIDIDFTCRIQLELILITNIKQQFN